MYSRTSLAVLALSLASPAFAQEHADKTLDEIIVTSTPLNKTRETLSQGVSVLTGADLNTRMEGTIGETLVSLPGVSSTFFGPGASRPIIRGLGGDRVEVLVNGLGAIDASTVSPDHAVAGESLSVKSVEVIRGPNTLLYGPSAIGGVVNIIDGRIPMEMPEGAVEGRARLTYGTNADERTAAGGVTFGLGDQFAAHAEGSWRKADDYHVPAGALAGGKVVEHSALKDKTGSAGFSWIGGDGSYLGAAISRTDDLYGVPGEEEGVQIDLGQTRVDLMGQANMGGSLIQSAKMRFAWADYKHAELEDGETGTTFHNKGWQGRLELVQQPMGNLTGAVGVQLKYRNFDSVGEEAVAPHSKTTQYGVFLLEEYALGAVTVQGGLRLDRADIDANDIGQSRDFTALSGSIGAIWDLTEDVALTAHLSHTRRNPTAEELYSSGPHLATGAFEQGDALLGSETANGIEGGVRLHGERWALHGQVYYTDYADFIYLADTGDEEDGLPIRQFAATDAEFYGFEAEGDLVLIGTLQEGLHLHLQADTVRASMEGGNGHLPRIPPFTGTAGLAYLSPLFDAGAEVAYTAKQGRVAEFEEPTGDHTFVNAHLEVRPFQAMPDLALGLRVRNLFNTIGYNHTSFLKAVAPQPGRDVRFSVNLAF